jgi:hypothetical protein
MMNVGIPSPEQIPQEVLLPSQDAPPEMVVDVLGVRVPAAMLESGYFWAFLIVAAVTVLGVAYFKYRQGNDPRS